VTTFADMTKPSHCACRDDYIVLTICLEMTICSHSYQIHDYCTYG